MVPPSARWRLTGITAKGIPFARTKALAKMLNAVDVVMPNWLQIAPICAFTSESIRNVIFVSIIFAF